MKVLHVFKDAYPPTYGGVEQHLWELTQSLAGEFEFEILTASRSCRRIEEWVGGVRFVRAPEYGRLLSTPLAPSWWNALRRCPSAIHLHLPVPLAELACLASRPEGPLIASYYADAVRHPKLAPAYAVLQQRFLARADRIVVSSAILAERSPALARHQDRIVVIPFGVDAAESPPDPGRVAELRRRHRGPIVLFLGRLVYYKGVDVLIEAMGRVDGTLVVAGDGPQRSMLERAAVRLPSARVAFVGPVGNRDRSAYYQAADVAVLPSVSRAETFGIAMLEAMSFGTPVVSTEVGTATSWVNVDGETGMVVAPRDSEALARAITTLLSDDSRRKRMGEAAARRAREHFAKDTMVQAFARMYRSPPSSA